MEEEEQMTEKKEKKSETAEEIQERAARVAKAWGAAHQTAEAAKSALEGGVDVGVVAKLLNAAGEQYRAIAQQLKDEYGG